MKKSKTDLFEIRFFCLDNTFIQVYALRKRKINRRYTYDPPVSENS